MSQEDVAAGRKSNWTGVEITGTYLSIITKCNHNSLFVSIFVFTLSPYSQAMCAILAQFYGNLNI